MKIKTASALARYLNCSNACITRWLDRGLPHEVDEKIQYVFDLEEVLKWLWGRSRRHRSWVKNVQKRLAEERTIMEKKHERMDKDSQKDA